MPKDTQLRAILNHFGRVAPQVDWQMSRHIHHEFNELIVVMSGGLEVTIQGECICAQRGDILTYPRGVWHTEKAVSGEPLETLFVAWQWRDPASQAVLWPLHATDRTGRVQGLVRWLHELSPPTRPVEEHMVGVLLDAVLFEVAQLGQSREQKMVARVKAYVQNHMADPMTLQDLADQAGLSKYHFSREFGKATGVTPMAFLRQVRVEAARSLLLSTSWTLKAIAAQVGFRDEFQLSRIFRRVTGTAPSSLRSE
jgi:AraC-like DNA-binding protein/mannose-6-phosphate isomerase-like protein (cupin superfamily)